MFCPFLEKYNNLNKIGNLNQGCPFLIKRKINRSSDNTYIVLLIWVILLLLMFVFFVLFYNKRVDIDIDDTDDEIENKKIFLLRLPVQIPQKNISLGKSKAVVAEGGVEEATEVNEADCDVVEAEGGASKTTEGTEADEEPDCEVVEDTEDRRSLLSKLNGSRNIL